MIPKSTQSKSPLILLASFLLGLLASSASTQADLITLYDGNALPGDQPWLVFAADTLTGWSQTPAAGGTHLTTNNATRAGYSFILLGHDAKGIELGFWSNEIWAQNPNFTHAESISIDTTVERNYTLQIIDEQYKLLDGKNTLLSGTLRDYPTPFYCSLPQPSHGTCDEVHTHSFDQ
jgi:hypothetical protein